MKLNIKKIQAEMSRLELTQSELAKRMKVSRQRVNFIMKNGATSLNTVIKIGKAFGMDPKDLII